MATSSILVSGSVKRRLAGDNLFTWLRAGIVLGCAVNGH